ncbi:MAG: hypothetical protein KGL36_07290 [Gammaproteobacteria bacterium]|nr:hypothetical protein [Gammaproteobacteria bacterium]
MKAHYLSLALVLSGVVDASPRFPPSVSAIPLPSCTPSRALSVDYVSSVDRQGDAANQAILLINRIKKISALATNPRESIGKQLTPTQIENFENLRSQLIMNQMGQLAESRLQRDDHVMSNAVDNLDGVPINLKNKSSRDGLRLLAAFGIALGKYSMDVMRRPSNTSTCSIDVAFFNAERNATVRLINLERSNEMTMYSRLQEKYKTKGPLEPKKLPSPDREEAAWLNKALIAPLRRDSFDVSAWEDLRRFSHVSRLEYKALRNDIINGNDSSKDSTINKIYASADAETKQTIKVWNAIDSTIPSDQVRLLEMSKKLMNQAKQ